MCHTWLAMAKTCLFLFFAMLHLGQKLHRSHRAHRAQKSETWLIGLCVESLYEAAVILRELLESCTSIRNMRSRWASLMTNTTPKVDGY